MNTPINKLRAFHLTMVHHYTVCALWSSTGYGDKPLDAVYSSGDLCPHLKGHIETDCALFLALCGGAIGEDCGDDCMRFDDPKESEFLSAVQMGHDFWLSRNGHGAGFFDRGLGEVGDRLQTLARSFGEEYWTEIGNNQLGL